MSCFNNRYNYDCYNSSNGYRGENFLQHIRKYVGETVTVFTSSGGASGCGFTGVVLAVNHCFLRLVTEQGTPPANPLAENICGDVGDDPGFGGKGIGGAFCKGNDNVSYRAVGSVCDVPIDQIVAFCHNAV